MPRYIVSVEKGLKEEEYEAATACPRPGGNIVDTFDREGVAPGFVVEFSADAVGTMEKAPNVKYVESDQEVKTQKD